MGSIKGVNVNSNITNIDPTSSTNTTPISANLSNFFNNSNNDIEELDLNINEKVDDIVGDLILERVKKKVEEELKEKLKEKFIEETGIGELQNDFHELFYGKNITYNEIYEDGFIPQGYTHVDQIFSYGKDLITAYNKKGENSRIYVYDKNTAKLEGIIILDNKNHVGGVSFDKANNVLWVTASNGEVEAYNYKKLMNSFYDNKSSFSNRIEFDMRLDRYKKNSESNQIKIPNEISVKELLSKNNKILGFVPSKHNGMDSIYFFDNKLYSCSFTDDGELICSEIEYVYDNKFPRNVVDIKLKKDSYSLGKLNGATQGLAFYKENGKTYLITSSSVARSESRLTKWEITDDGLKEIGYHYIEQPCLEGIEIKGGRIFGVFEDLDKEKDANKVEDLGSLNDFSTEKHKGTDLLLKGGGAAWDVIN